MSTGAADRDGGVRSITAALGQVGGHWQPHRLATVNDLDVKVVTLLGEFVWHSHPDTDEMFAVVSGRLVLQLRAGDVVLGPGDVYVVPRGVEHCPRAEEEVRAVLLERVGTLNTGDAAPGRLTAPLRELA